MYSVIEDVLMADEFSKLNVVVHQPLNSIIRDPHKLTDEETAYAMNSWTHVDFLIYNYIDKSPVLAIEVKNKPEVILSYEHTTFKWVNFQEASEMLYWKNNVEALTILHQQITASSM